MENKSRARTEYDSDMPTGYGPAGDIKINYSVVATIVRLAALEVDGVVGVGTGGLVDEIAGIFTKRETTSGILVDETDQGHYHVTARLILAYGVDLVKTASEAQYRIRSQITRMTGKQVSRVDVMIEGVRTGAKDSRSPEGNLTSIPNPGNPDLPA
ncbi:MAG: Asp23/Gls24 family envelope stress response protein [Verrucomicrobiota bacterium]|nr:Asp23/Gls24 family envelope stress response protein [Verrucomicrobiota bacterium]